MENKQSAEQTEHFGIGRNKWRITILVIFLFLALLGSFLSLTKGSSIISIKEITDILLNPGNDPRSQIIWNIRMPRTIVGALVGINLSLSGAILQAIMRNPLADPHIIGIRCCDYDFVPGDGISDYACCLHRCDASCCLHLYSGVEKRH